MPSPENPVDDDRLLMQYLLGALPEAEAERLDELSIADDEFASRLRAAENDLVDAHACGELTGETLERFQSFYLSSASRRKKARFAEAFRSFVDRPPIVRMSGARSRGPWFRAAACLTLLAGGYLLYQNVRLRDEVSQSERARAGIEQHERELESQLAGERSAGVETQKELERVRKSQAQLRPGPAAGIAAFLLLPPTRGLGDLTTIVLPAGTGHVDFEMRLESDDFPEYRVALKDPAAGQVLWRSGRLKAISRGADKELSVSPPASLLKPQNYVLEITGGASEFIGGYPIRVMIR